MRIAMIGAKGVPATIGGIERHVEELAARLTDAGFAVTAYARPWYTGRAPWSRYLHRGICVLTLPSVHTKHLDAISHTLLATLHAMVDGFDVYHFHGVGPALCAWIPRLFRPSARVVVTFHCVDRKHAKWGWFARAALTVGEWAACRFPHETIAVGETLAAYCGRRYWRAVACIPNGVAPLPAVPRDVARDVLRTLNLAPQRYLLVVSRLVPHKAIGTVISAFRQLQRERSEFRDLRLAIVGAPAFTDAYGDALRVQAAGDPAVCFLGQRSGAALGVLYRNCIAFIHASMSEGLPIALLEAAAAGAVPIVSDIPEHREVLARIGGFCFRAGDVHDLQFQLETLLMSRRSLPRIGAHIREAVLRHYDWDVFTARTISCYANTPPTRVGGVLRAIRSPHCEANRRAFPLLVSAGPSS